MWSIAHRIVNQVTSRRQIDALRSELPEAISEQTEAINVAMRFNAKRASL